MYYSLIVLLTTIICSSTAFNVKFGTRTARQASVTTNCTTVGNGAGICIHIKKCPYIMTLLRNNRSDPNVRSYLLKSKCGGSGTNILVCCSTNETDYRFDGASLTQPTPTVDESMRLPSPPECGISEVPDVPRIVGGQPAVAGAWPWLAALGYTTNDKNPERVWRCAGSLINKRYVITAGHCVNSSGLSVEVVRLGELDLSSENDGSLHVDYGIEKIITHDRFQSATQPDDIALIRLNKEVSYTQFIKPICLPTPEMASKTFESFSPFIAGWGSVEFRGPSSNHLLQTQVKVVLNYECAQAYISKKTVVTSRQICAGFKNKFNDACKGDSGGPLMWPEGRTYYVIGLVSFGLLCGQPSYPTVYTRVSSYIEWITDQIQQPATT